MAPALPEDPRSPLPGDMSDDVEAGLQLSEGCSVSCAKDRGPCWDVSSTGHVPWCPGPALRGVSTKSCHRQTPSELYFGLLGLGLDSHLLWVVMFIRVVGW